MNIDFKDLTVLPNLYGKPHPLWLGWIGKKIINLI